MQRSETTLLYKALCCGAANHSAIPEVKQRSKSVVPPMMRGRRRSVARVGARTCGPRVGPLAAGGRECQEQTSLTEKSKNTRFVTK